MWWLVFLVSVALTCTGVWLLVRDHASMFVAPKSAQPAPTLDRPVRPEATQPPPPSPPVSPDLSAGFSSTPPVPHASPTRLPAVEAHWFRLRSEIDTAVQAANASLGPTGVAIGAAGEPSWSLHDRGFGDYRRVRVGRESIAWLRMELAADLSISAHLRTHEPRYDMLNRSSMIGRPLVANRIGPALAECLSALTAAAPRLMPASPPAAVVAPPAPRIATTTALMPQRSNDVEVPSAVQGQGRSWPKWLSRPTPMEEAAATQHPAAPPAGLSRTLTAPPSHRAVPRQEPSAVEALIDTAVTLVNSAFEETGARLVPAPSALRLAGHGAGSRPLSIDLAGTSLGLMLIEPHAERIDIIFGISDPAHPRNAQRLSHGLPGLTVHPLAETIATCAWPPIAAATGGA